MCWCSLLNQRFFLALYKENFKKRINMAVEITNANFEELVAGDKPVVIDFWAEWCGPCRMIAPVIDELAGDFDGKAKICKVNTDEEQDVAIKYGIRSIPTILFFKNGELVDQMIGASSKQVLADKINSLL